MAVALTTVDNPYNPLTDFEHWWQFDTDRGYNSCAYLSRIAITSDSLTDKENERILEDAIDEILKYDFLNLYAKVTDRDDKNNEE